MSKSGSTFYSDARSGLAALNLAASTAPDLVISLKLLPLDEPALTVARDKRRLRLMGPGDVLDIAPQAIASVWPPADSTFLPYNLFASIDFREEDLPWRLSPAPAETSRRQPWVALVVLPASEEVTLTAAAAPTPAVLRVQGAARQLLPDLTRVHLFVHVQERDGVNIARAICPLSLAPSTEYVAALVPTFLGGRQAGLGQRIGADPFAPAWTADETRAAQGTVDLPAYVTWRFRTSGASDFSALAAKLHAAETAPPVKLGSRTVRIGPCPYAIPREPPAGWSQTLWTALTGTASPPPPEETVAQRDWFARACPTPRPGPFPLPSPYDPLRDDPIHAPPVHGATVGGQKAPWRASLNSTPVFRALAGVGAEVVRRHQEELTQALLEKLHTQRQDQRAQRRLQVSLSVAWSRVGRVSLMPAASVVLLAGFVARTNESLFPASIQSRFPDGVFSAAMKRQVRFDARAGIRTRAAGTPLPARPSTPRTELSSLIERFDAGALDRLRRWDPHTRAGGGVAPAQVLTAAAERTRAEFRPLKALDGRLSDGLKGVLNRGAAAFGSRHGVQASEQDCTLDIPLAAWLRALAPDLLLSGIGAFPEHGVALVHAHNAAVEAMLVGANEALSQEIVWRDLPVPRGATLLRRFWEGSASADVASIRDWTGPLGSNGAASASFVLVLRSPLVKLYPGLEVARVASRDGAPDLRAASKLPAFQGQLDDTTLYAGFAGSSTDRDWYIELRQPAGRPAFGVNVGSSLGSFKNAAEAASKLHRPRVRIFLHAASLLPT
jgi:hypothetical protein